MSKSQQRLTDMEMEHRTKNRVSSRQREHGEHEWTCLGCGTSITVNPTSGEEYGHAAECDRTPKPEHVRAARRNGMHKRDMMGNFASLEDFNGE